MMPSNATKPIRTDDITPDGRSQYYGITSETIKNTTEGCGIHLTDADKRYGIPIDCGDYVINNDRNHSVLYLPNRYNKNLSTFDRFAVIGSFETIPAVDETKPIYLTVQNNSRSTTTTTTTTIIDDDKRLIVGQLIGSIIVILSSIVGILTTIFGFHHDGGTAVSVVVFIFGFWLLIDSLYQLSLNRQINDLDLKQSVSAFKLRCHLLRLPIRLWFVGLILTLFGLLSAVLIVVLKPHQRIDAVSVVVCGSVGTVIVISMTMTFKMRSQKFDETVILIRGTDQQLLKQQTVKHGTVLTLIICCFIPFVVGRLIRHRK